MRAGRVLRRKDRGRPAATPFANAAMGTMLAASASQGRDAQQVGPPMSEKQQNLQDTFLNAVRKSKSSVTIFLVNGVKLQGNITWFDNFCVLLRRDGHSQLVYKHAISTIMPGQPIQMFEPGDEAGHAGP